MFLIQRIEDYAYQTKDTRKQISEFLLKEKSNASNYSMQEIADMNYTSKATLVRYAKKMGFTGWKEFMTEFVKEVYYEETHFSAVDPNMPFNKTDTTQTIVENLTTILTEILQDTAKQLDLEALDKAAKIVLSSKHVVVFGTSPNNIIGDLFKRKMKSIGKLIEVTTNDSGLTARALNKGDCAIIISYSGSHENHAPLKYVQTLIENEVIIIGITNSARNYLRNYSHCLLTISSRENLYNKIAPFTTEASINHVLNLLFSCCFAADYQKNYDFKIRNSASLESERKGILKEIKD